MILLFDSIAAEEIAAALAQLKSRSAVVISVT